MRLSGLTQLDEGRPLRHLEVRLVPTDSKTYRLFWDTGGEWVVKHMVLEAQKRLVWAAWRLDPLTTRLTAADCISGPAACIRFPSSIRQKRRSWSTASASSSSW